MGKYSLFYTGCTKIAAEKPKIESLKTDVMGKCLFPIFLEVPNVIYLERFTDITNSIHIFLTKRHLKNPLRQYSGLQKWFW